MKLLTLQQIQRSLNSVKALISKVLDNTVDALTELDKKIPTKVSQLDNDEGFLTQFTANGYITLTTTLHEGETSVTFTDSNISADGIFQFFAPWKITLEQEPEITDGYITITLPKQEEDIEISVIFIPNAMKVESIDAKINEQDDKINILNDSLTDLKKSVADVKSLIASAITSKGVNTSSDASFQVMANNIRDIKTNPKLQTKTVTPDTTAKTYKPDTGYDGFSEFTVSAIAAGSGNFNASNPRVKLTNFYFNCPVGANGGNVSVSSNGYMTIPILSTDSIISWTTSAGNITVRKNNSSGETITNGGSVKGCSAVYISGDAKANASGSGTANPQIKIDSLSIY